MKASQSAELEQLESNSTKATSTTPAFVIALMNWYEWNKSRVRFWAVYVFALIAFALWGYFENMHITVPPYLAYAKIFGKALDFLLVILIIPILRNFLSYLRTTPVAELLPLDDSLTIHMYTGYLIMLCAVGHIGFHYSDFEWLERMRANPIWESALLNLPGFTGHLIAVLMLIVLPTTLLNRRIRTIMGIRFDGYIPSI
jgi:hypothetical protein